MSPRDERLYREAHLALLNHSWRVACQVFRGGLETEAELEEYDRLIQPHEAEYDRAMDRIKEWAAARAEARSKYGVKP